MTATTAKLSGQVNPNGSATTYQFQYGSTSGSLTSSSSSTSAGAGTSASGVSAELTGLDPSKTYYYRLVATNAGGTTDGPVMNFTTAASSGGKPGTPGVSTGVTKSVTATSARLTGAVTPNGVATSYHFELGTGTRYGKSTKSVSAGSGAKAIKVSALVTKLKPGTRYHYRLDAVGPGGTVHGSDRTFRTKPAAAFSRPPRRVSLTSLGHGGLTVHLSCIAACSAKVRLTISGSVAKALGLGTKTVTLAEGKGSEKRGGTFAIHLDASRRLPNLSNGQRGLLSATVTVTRRTVTPNQHLTLTH